MRHLVVQKWSSTVFVVQQRYAWLWTAAYIALFISWSTTINTNIRTWAAAPFRDLQLKLTAPLLHTPPFIYGIIPSSTENISVLSDLWGPGYIATACAIKYACYKSRNWTELNGTVRLSLLTLDDLAVSKERQLQCELSHWLTEEEISSAVISWECGWSPITGKEPLS